MQRKTGILLRALRLFWFAPILSLWVAGCNVSKEEKDETTISFDRIADSLKKFDNVVIILKSPSGAPIDTVFNGKVNRTADVQKLKAPHWDGGKVIVFVSGTKDGKLAYQVETNFDPATGSRDSSVIMTPDASLSSSVRSLTLLVGDSLGLPVINVSPGNLLNKLLDWSASPPELIDVGPDYLKARQAGSGTITVRLKSNPDIIFNIAVTISTSGEVPDSIQVQPDSLTVAVGGAPGTLSAKVSPSAAPSAVDWKSADTSIATVDAAGRVFGKSQGYTSVSASSQVRPKITASALVTVTGAVSVQSVAFPTDSLEIRVNGPAVDLAVSVLPGNSNQAVTYTLSDPAKASIQTGKITGIAAGRISVIAASVSNPAAKDTLIVQITVPTINDTIPPLKPIVHVSPAGPTRNLKPVWGWTSGGGGGAGSFQTSLDNATFDATTPSVTDTAFTPSANLTAGSHVLYVRERDAAGNWSLPGSAQVDIDTTGPSLPKLLGTSPTSALPRWNWSSGGGGGAGVYRSRLADANFPANASESPDSAYALTTAASGTTYTLYVEERDAAGNWSAPASLAIKYDLTKPTVTIALPQASGTFTTALASVTVSGTSTGPNTITKIEYTLDTGSPSAATLGTGGNWSIAALTLANGQTTTITVTATDNLGNTGQAVLKVLRDSDVPLPPTALVKPTSPTNAALSTWSWGAGGDGAAGSGLNGNYRWKLNAGNWTETTTASATGVTLAEGTNTFSVEEQDKAGNWSDPLTGTVVLDTKVPDAVSFVGIDGTLTADDTPTWTWAPSASNGGIGSYILKVDAGAEFDGGTAVTYTPITPLADNATHTLTVKEKDQVAGVTSAAKSFSYKIKVNPPAAPTVKSAVASLVNNSPTNNPGFTWTTGGGGNGKYRVRVNTETSYRINGIAQSTFSLANSDADGTYTLSVSEQDDLGRYGPEGSFTIKLDRTVPQFANAMIEGKTFPLRDGFITNAPSLVITYTSDGALKSFTCTLTDGAAKLCKDAAQTDAAGNSATFQISIWSRSNVVFFSPTGTGDGSSWEEADGVLQTHIGLPDANGKEFWLATGNYAAKNVSLDLTDKLLTILGGFSLSTFPTNNLSRSKTATTIGGFTSISGKAPTFDGLTFTESVEPTAMGTSTNHVQFIDCTFKTNLNIRFGSVIDFKNCSMINVNNGKVPIYLETNSTIVWDGGQITNNPPPSFESFSITVNETCSATFRNMTIANNINSSFHFFQAYTTGNLVLESVLTFKCLDDIFISTGATGSCNGTPIVP